MFTTFFRTIFYFQAAAWRSLTGLRGKDDALYYSGTSLKKKTFRFPEKANRDFLVSLRIYKQILCGSLKKNRSCIKTGSTSGEAIFDTSINAKDLRLEYIKKLTGVSCDIVVAKNNLLFFYNVNQVLLITTLLILSAVPVFAASVFSANKLKTPLLLLEMVEAFNLQLMLRGQEIRKVHYFCIYERDANICAYVLMKSGLFVNKIPSEVPLVFANQVIVSNQLSFCFAYQREEFDIFRQTMFVEKTEQWVPEQFFVSRAILDREEPSQSEAGSIGFFSSGNWLREALGDADLGRNDKKNEEHLLKTILEYSQTNNTRVYIFLHPIEKRKENLALSESYYREILQRENVHLADPAKSSVEGFHKVDVGIAQYSTLLFERLVLGFKTIIAPWGYPEFPLASSPLQNCCALTAEEVHEKLKRNLGISRSEFISINGLKSYVYNNTPLYNVSQ